MPAIPSETNVIAPDTAVQPQSALERGSGAEAFLPAEMSLPALLVLTLLPWFLAVLFTAGISAGIHLLGYAAMLSAIGYGIVSAAGLASGLETVLLAPALGLSAIAALGAVWLRLGMSVRWLPLIWLVLMLASLPRLWVDRSRIAAMRTAWGWTLAALSLLICVIFFLPGARADSVLRADGSFNWIYVDTQHFYAIAAGIRGGQTPPVGPGTATEPLLYHFGPYVPAAAISRLDGLNLGDALMRVTRGASIWALVLSCFGLGTLLALRCGGDRFGGLMSVAGLFFYGSLLSLFSNETNSASHVTGAILFTIPGVEVLADGGPFSHLILGHSELHGLVAITGVLTLCLAAAASEALSWRRLILLVLPALVAPVNSVSALYCLGMAGILLFWGRLRSPRAWLEMLIMAALFFAAWRTMGFSHAPDAAMASLNHHPGAEWWMIVVAFLIGLGFRITGFAWISNPLKDPLAAVVLASVVGLLSFTVLLQLSTGNQHYGVYFLECMLSIFAFSRLKYGFWRSTQLWMLIREWFGIAAKGMLLLTVAGLGLVALTLVTHHHSGVKAFPVKLALSTATLLVLFAGAALLQRYGRGAVIASRATALILLVGFLAWITPWLNFGMDRMRMDISIPAGEVQGLHRLGQLAAPDERFATNQHALPQLADRRERSYAYAALSERPVLLEGYLDRGVEALPWFPSMLHDNDRLFTTTDPQVLRNLASRWQVQWLVARPGTDISLPKPLPPWLVQQSDTGTLRIYRIN